MATSVKKKIFLLVFCLSNIVQGMYSTYFVSILTTIERIYQIQSKTAGAIMSATEVGQILGALLIAYYGGKGNKPKWIAACMTITAIAALISTLPHFLLKKSSETSPYLTSDLNTELSTKLQLPHKLILPSQDELCLISKTEELSSSSLLVNIKNNNDTVSELHTKNNNHHPINLNSTYRQSGVLVIFFICLLAIGFGSTAINTLGIPFIDDIVSKEESPLYLGLTIGLRIFGPALGFLLGSFCIRLDVNLLTLIHPSESGGGTPVSDQLIHNGLDSTSGIGAWWLGLIIISIPLVLLALTIYILSKFNTIEDDRDQLKQFEDITYQAAEDHDIGGSRDFEPHILTIGDLDVTSNGTCYSEVDSSSREVLQTTSTKPHTKLRYNFNKNISLDQQIITRDSILSSSKNESGAWPTSCVVVNHFGGLKSTSFTHEEAKSLHTPCLPPSTSSSNASSPSSSSSITKQSNSMNLSSSLLRLIDNRLLLLRLFSGVLHIVPIAGFYTFFPKYLMEQFRIAPSSASAISGLAGIMFVGFGTFLGGTIIRLFNINSKIMTRWIATSALLYAIGMLILMNIGCAQNKIVHYENTADSSTLDKFNYPKSCKCSSSIYSPVCANGTTFLSPCLAGCKEYSIVDDKIIFDDCSYSNQTSSSSSLPKAINDEPYLNLNIATQGGCQIQCDNLYWYILLFSVFTLIHSSSEVGAMMFNLRCVKSSDRTLALGLTTFMNSLLGTIPCSILYGTVIDFTCIYWDKLENPADPTGLPINGACLAYKNETFRFYLHGTTGMVMFLAFIIDCIICSRAKEVDFYEKDDSKMGVTVGLEKSTETI